MQRKPGEWAERIVQSNEHWEHGSDFHCAQLESGKAEHPWNSGCEKYGSGRDALRALLRYGAQELGWRRVFVPSFFCQDVVAAMKCGGLDLVLYSDSPREGPVWPADIRAGDAVFVVNYFGLRYDLDTAGLRELGAMVIEDHSHDPWSDWARTSRADYCLVALRKTLPLPEGGVIWSPREHGLPQTYPVTATRQRAADAKRAGMLLKRLYLQGLPVAKEEFRALLVAGEEEIAAEDISGMTNTSKALLDWFPVTQWRDQRARNFHETAQALEQMPGLTILRPVHAACVPFNVTLVTDTASQCARLRKGLIARQIYPATLWSLEHPQLPGTPERHVDLSRRILSLHCDSRYSSEDMRRVAVSVIEIMTEAM